MRTSAAVALISFAVYLATFRPFVSMDATTNVLVAYGFVREGTAYLDTAMPHWNEIPFFWQRHGEHVISWTWYAPGVDFVAAPVVWLGALAGIVPPDPASVTVVGRIAAALCAAASVLFVHAAAALVTGRRWAVLVAALYAFGTATWPTSAGGLWQHGPAQLAVAAGVYFLLVGRRSPPWSARAGLAFAAAVVIRPQDVVFLVAAWVLVLLRSRRAALLYGAWACAPLAMLVAYGLVMFGMDLPQVAKPPPAGNVLVGMAGNLVSPSRGIFVSSPVLILAAIALVRGSFGRGTTASTVRALALAAAGVLVVHSQYGWWWGGNSYLNRYLADALPVLALGLALWLRRHHTSLRARVLVGALAVPSVAIAAVGALAYEWRDALWEDSTQIPTEDLVWIPDRMQALYALTTSPRFDALTFFGLGVSVVAAVLLTIVARRPARHPRDTRRTRALRGAVSP